MKKKAHRMATVLLAAAMTVTMAAVPAFPAFSGSGAGSAARVYAATTFKDVPYSHWARAYIQKAVSQGIISGYTDGTFKPDKAITRAEFTRMLNAALGNTNTLEPNFSDVRTGDWFYDDVSKGVAASFISGYDDGTFLPSKTISRQEAAAIMARIVPAYGSDADLTKFKDAKSVGDWAVPAMKKIVGKGYINGADNKLMPNDSLTRAQAAKIIVDMVEGETIIKKNQTIVQTGVIIKDKIYSNQISVGTGVKDGNAKFDNSVILGNINIEGGGSSASDGIQLLNSRASRITVSKDDGSVRVLAKGESTVVSSYITDSAILAEENLSGSGGFGSGFVNVYMERKSDLDLQADVEKLELLGSKCDASISKGFSAGKITVDKDSERSDIRISEGAKAGTVDVNGEGTALHGKGTVDTINVNADSLTYEAEPGTLNVADSVAVKPVLNIDPSAALTISIKPVSDATDVSVSDNIEVKFSSTVHATGSDKPVLTDTQAQSLILLKKDDSTGENIPCNITVNNNGAGVTIDPEGTLAHGTTYYVRIGQGDLTDMYGNKSDLFISGFTTTGTKQATSAELNSLEVGVDDGSDISYSPMSTNADASNVYYIGTKARTVSVKISTLIPSPAAVISLNTDKRTMSESEGETSFQIPAGTGDPGTIEIKLSSADGDYADTTYKVVFKRLTPDITSAAIQGSDAELKIFDSAESAQSANPDEINVSEIKGKSVIDLSAVLAERSNTNAVSVTAAKYDPETDSWKDLSRSDQTAGAWTLGQTSDASSADGIYRIVSRVNVCGSSTVNGTSEETSVKYLNLSFK